MTINPATKHRRKGKPVDYYAAFTPEDTTLWSESKGCQFPNGLLVGVRVGIHVEESDIVTLQIQDRDATSEMFTTPGMSLRGEVTNLLKWARRVVPKKFRHLWPWLEEKGENLDG